MKWIILVVAAADGLIFPVRLAFYGYIVIALLAIEYFKGRRYA